LGKATAKAIAEVIRQVRGTQIGPGERALAVAHNQRAVRTALRRTEGTVQLVDGKEVWVSLGSKDGLEKGESLSVYEPCPKRNSRGERGLASDRRGV